MVESNDGLNLADEMYRARKQLLDLTGNNRLLNYRKSKRDTLQIVDELPNEIWSRLSVGGEFEFVPKPDWVVEAGQQDESDDWFDDEYESDRSDEANSLDDESSQLRFSEELPEWVNRVRQSDRHTDNKLQTMLTEAKLESVLKNIRQKANSSITETGVNLLYLSLGLLEWYDAKHSERPNYAPLFLVPVQMTREYVGTQRKYRITYTGEELLTNVSLALKLEEDFGIKLGEIDEDTEPEAYFDSVREVIQDHPAWSVRREALLGFFWFSKLLMYKDLNPELWGGQEGFEGRKVLTDLMVGASLEGDVNQIGFKPDYSIDENELALSIPLAMDADSSQHSALCDIAEGKSLVIEGPPGTGKSQTITNAIAAALGQGKKVLFVAEKLAALQVVKKNLDRIGLGEFCLELHSDSAKPQKVYGDLERRLTTEFPSAQSLERARERLYVQQQKIEDYLQATKQRVGPHKERVDEVFWRVASHLSRGLEPLQVQEIAGTEDEPSYTQCTMQLQALQRHADEIGPLERHPWRDVDMCLYRSDQQEALENILNQWLKLVGDLEANSAKLYRFASLPINDWLTLAEAWEPAAARSFLDQATPSPRMARACLPVDARETLRRLVQELETWRNIQQAFEQESLIAWSEAEQPCQSAWSAWDRSIERMPDDTPLPQVESTKIRLEAIADFLDTVIEHAEQLGQLGLQPAPRTFSEFASAIDEYEHLCKPIAQDTERLSASLFQAQTEQIYIEAKSKASELASEEAQIGEILSIRDMPSLEDVTRIRREIRPYVGRRLRIFSSQYRKSKRELQQYVALGKKHQLIERVEALGQYEDFHAKVEAFKSDEHYASCLGLHFQGRDTDWEKLKETLVWVNQAAAMGMGYAKVVALLEKRRAMQDERSPDELKAPLAMRQNLQGLQHELSDELVQLLLAFDSANADHHMLHELRAAVTEADEDCETFGIAASGFRNRQSWQVSELHRFLEAVDQGIKLRHKVDTSPEYPALLGEDFSSVQTEPEPIQYAIDWLMQLEELGLSQPAIANVLLEDVSKTLSALFDAVGLLQDQAAAWSQWCKQLADYGQPDASESGLQSLVGTADDAFHKQRLLRLHSEIDQVSRWANCCRDRHQAAFLGLELVCDQLFAGIIPHEKLIGVYQSTVFNCVANQVIKEQPILRDFSRQAITQAREEYAKLDRKLTKLARKSIAKKVSERTCVAGTSSGRVATYTEMGLIRHEVSKQRRFCRIRELVRRAPISTAALKPCFMMSPLSVAQYLPPGSIEFDLVIMDEASQIKPEDALGTAIRAKQLVVVGDPKQLPPTSFFEKLGSSEAVDEEDEIALDNAESVLEVAMRGFTDHRRLRWHYRSQHPSLIAFSNQKFYDNELIVFPSPSSESGRLGVRFHKVDDGEFQGGANLVEAQKVAEAITQHVIDCPDETLGVGTFNQKQRELIEDCLDRLCLEDPLLLRKVEDLRDPKADYPLFIKNLENLQGDERDVIFISYTYGPDPASGRVMQRFGPMNKENGWRRLNVLVTRAKRRVEVFSSMEPTQIVPKDGSSLGVVSMRDYLRYARTGLVKEQGEETDRTPDSPFEVAVGNVVRQLGFDFKPQVGVAGYFIDLGVCCPGRSDDFMLGIECDGATYHSSRSARDRDRLREEVITSRGWELHRIWSTDWFLNYEDEVLRLKKAIRKAEAKLLHDQGK